MLVFPEDKSLDLVHSLIKDTFPLDIMTETDFSPPQASGINPQTLGALKGFSRLARETL
jgi:hypothetical protein